MLARGKCSCSAYVGSMCGGKQHTRGPNAKKHQQQMTSKRDVAGRSIDGRVGGTVEDKEG